MVLLEMERLEVYTVEEGEAQTISAEITVADTALQVQSVLFGRDAQEHSLLLV
jgi:hypothetical protein